ncbi:acyl-CoA dehydrogenase [Advenella kashmirensis W13003]|uniref:Acyl-CoA dehydrogenase n=1 Tax=Advenella kashmirensis W13003 TaxID=1424334 RepID=V8QXB2_9BURK|nr:MaoC family dehydratase N-terminal domain-containing protein [Advenella kashmirensis]ETF03960.1 acyl-CoA dehydrogenase [Advenella kashmirensis W13003]
MIDANEWIGRQVSDIQTIEAWPLNGLKSLIGPELQRDAVDARAAVHPCAHWLYFVPVTEQSGIDVDGHPKRGDFIPPLALPRRMWAKSAITFAGDIMLGDRIEKVSTIASVDQKSGKSGELVFLEIDHKYLQDSRLLRHETQTIVYRDHQRYEDSIFTQLADEMPQWSHPTRLGPVELFRYSAITFNAHRIHYDADYTRNVEGYPSIIVQGQFIATLALSRALAALGMPRCKKFTFKAVKPVFSEQTVFIEGRKSEDGKILAWARQEDGRLNMTAEIEL